MVLELKDIHWKTESGEPILDGINLSIDSPKLLVITGPNGGGKTTLAKVISGLYHQSSGTILLDNTDISEFDVTQRAQNGISFAFQQPVRFKGITVSKLLELSSSKSMSYSKQCEVLSRVGLCAREYIDREIDSTLSGGEIKRIEIASVIARHTKLTIFDEPEAGIDLWSFANLIDVFEQMRHDKQGTVIIISHQERILKIADEIVLVADGKIKAQGERDEMLKLLFSSTDMVSACSKQEAMFK